MTAEVCKKPYARPHLVVYGRIGEITKAVGGSGMGDGGGGGMTKTGLP